MTQISERLLVQAHLDAKQPKPLTAEEEAYYRAAIAAVVISYRRRSAIRDVGAALGIPAVNYGPGDPNLAHKRDEHVPVEQITRVADVLRGYLGK